MCLCVGRQVYSKHFFCFTLMTTLFWSVWKLGAFLPLHSSFGGQNLGRVVADLGHFLYFVSYTTLCISVVWKLEVAMYSSLSVIYREDQVSFCEKRPKHLMLFLEIARFSFQHLRQQFSKHHRKTVLTIGLQQRHLRFVTICVASVLFLGILKAHWKIIVCEVCHLLSLVTIVCQKRLCFVS